MMKATLMAAVAGLAHGECCKTCTGSDQKYYSVDMKHGHCGETCIYPGQFALYKVFEKNLTIADGSTGYTSCADLGWPKYQETVSHGDPLKLLVATLDLYGHDDAKSTEVTLPWLSVPSDKCSNKGDCGNAYQACCLGFQAEGDACGCHLSDGGSGVASGMCGDCGAAYTLCCAGFAAKGFPCTCDISDSGVVV